MTACVYPPSPFPYHPFDLQIVPPASCSPWRSPLYAPETAARWHCVPHNQSPHPSQPVLSQSWSMNRIQPPDWSHQESYWPVPHPIFNLPWGREPITLKPLEICPQLALDISKPHAPRVIWDVTTPLGSDGAANVVAACYPFEIVNREAPVFFAGGDPIYTVDIVIHGLPLEDPPCLRLRQRRNKAFPNTIGSVLDAVHEHLSRPLTEEEEEDLRFRGMGPTIDTSVRRRLARDFGERKPRGCQPRPILSDAIPNHLFQGLQPAYTNQYGHYTVNLFLIPRM